MRLGYSDLLGTAGLDLGHSRPYLVDQERIDRFADLTEDRQWIHVDPVLAAKSTFGATIAHGYLTLSFVAPILSELLVVTDAAYAVNYGLDRVRFPAPLISGSSVVGSATVATVTDLPGCVQLVIRVALHAEGATKPVCVADAVLRFFASPLHEGHDVRTNAAYH